MDWSFLPDSEYVCNTILIKMLIAPFFVPRAVLLAILIVNHPCTLVLVKLFHYTTIQCLYKLRLPEPGEKYPQRRRRRQNSSRRTTNTRDMGPPVPKLGIRTLRRASRATGRPVRHTGFVGQLCQWRHKYTWQVILLTKLLMNFATSQIDRRIELRWKTGFGHQIVVINYCYVTITQWQAFKHEYVFIKLANRRLL